MQRMRNPRSATGFTLIELMIAVAIVGILAAIAYPSYTSFVRKSNRTDATRTIMQDAQSLQRCYSQSFAYTTGCNIVASTVVSPGGHYSVTIDNLAAATYRIQAVPVGTQVGDTQCAIFTLLSTNVQSAKSSGGSDTTQACWGTN